MSVLRCLKLPLWVVLVTSVASIRIKNSTGWQNIFKNTRVVGGSDAEEGFAPYQASLQSTFPGDHFCGGAIISDSWILTASHCVYGASPDYVTVVIGTNKYMKFDKRYYTKAIYTHCNYDIPRMHNDIALIQLNESIIFDEYKQPISLPEIPMQEGDEVILTGWGSTMVWGDAPDNLQKIYLKYVPHKKCKTLMFDDPDLDVGHICTFTKVGEGACHGDSGGPLISNGKLVGVVNWGYPCAVGMPDAHANVYFFRDWIRNVISGNTKC